MNNKLSIQDLGHPETNYIRKYIETLCKAEILIEPRPLTFTDYFTYLFFNPFLLREF